jgi:CheY-like chemotaxis protein
LKTGPDGVVVRFEVTDTGIGMSQEQQERLFNPSLRPMLLQPASTEAPAWALYLKQLVELMGGEIGVESTPWRGKHLFLHLAVGEAIGRRAAARFDSPSELRGLRVLIVDDNETNRKVLHHQLSSWDMKNDSARDGAEALELLREAAQRGESYDLAILDMEMPEMDGLELAQRIKADPSLSSIKLVMLSSVGRHAEGERARQAGIEVYLTKPIKQSRLFDAIRTVIGEPAEELSTTSDTPAPSPTTDHHDDAPLVATRALRKQKERRHSARLLIARTTL